MSRAALIARYAQIDDESLAAMAGAGLLRRADKDLQAGKVALLAPAAEDPPDALMLEADGQQVILDGRGWDYCRCSCPAPGWCKHKLAAALFLRVLDDPSASLEPGPAGSASADPAQADSDPDARPAAVEAGPTVGESPALAEALALDPEQVLKEAGVAAVRRLPGLLQEAGQAQFQIDPQSLLITLPGLPASVRFLRHGGFAGMYSEGPQSQRKALHLTALWLLWQQHGGAPALPAELDTNVATGAELEAFLEQVRAMLIALLRQGLGHLSQSQLAALQSLNIDARAEALPAIAARLRSLESWAQRLASRDDALSEGEVLALITVLWANCEALRADHSQRAALAGQPRQFVDQDQPLDLLVLGSQWWQRASGARGLSLYFLQLNADPPRLLSAAHARSDGSDPNFHQHSAWSGAVYWPALGTAAQILADGTLQLRGARVSADGRIALGGQVSGSRGQPLRLDDPRAQTLARISHTSPTAAADLRAVARRAPSSPLDVVSHRFPAHTPTRSSGPRAAPQHVLGALATERYEKCGLGLDDWQQVGAQLAERYSLFAPAAMPLLLRPSRQLAPELDELAQCIRWTLIDCHGEALRLRLPCTEQHRTALQAVEYWGSRSPLLVLVEVEREPQFGLRPISLLTGESGCWAAHSLDQGAPTTKGLVSRLGGRIQRLLAKRRAVPASPDPGLAGRLLNPLLEILIAQATSGRPSLPESASRLLRDRVQLLHAAGLAALAEATERYRLEPQPAHLLRLHGMIQIALGLSAIDTLSR